MSVETELISIVLKGGGSLGVAYQVPFPFLDAAHLRVALKSQGDADYTPLAPLHYRVTQFANLQGEVYITNAPVPVDASVRIWRQTPVTQPMAFSEVGRIPPKTQELALDRLTLAMQELRGDVVTLPGKPLVSHQSIEWAREVWGPNEDIESATRWAGNIHRGGALRSVRISAAATGVESPGVQVLVNGAPMFSAPVSLTAQSMLVPAETLVITGLDDGAKVDVITLSPAGMYAGYRGLQLDLSLDRTE